MLAREGQLPLLFFALLGLAAAYLVAVWWSLPFWLIGAGVGYLFRMPRVPPIDLPLAVVSPVAGVIETVEPAFDPWFSRSALRVRIGVPFPGIGPIFSPTDGKIEDYWTDLAPDLTACVPGEVDEHGWLDDWLKSPTRYTVGLVTDGGDCVAYTVSSFRSHSRFKLDQAPGERVARSRRSGFVYFASTVDVLVPANSRAEVAVGQEIRAGSEIIATLIHG